MTSSEHAEEPSLRASEACDGPVGVDARDNATIATRTEPDGKALTGEAHGLDNRPRVVPPGRRATQIAEDFRRRAECSASLRFQLGLKRVFDFGASLALVILLSPLLVLSAILVKLSSPGPVFFVAPRYGKDGTTFPCYKFRSMRTDQDAIMSRHRLDFAAEGGRLLIHDADPRITRWGAIIRRTSIDELPQLFNVLRGEMSLVGPRPCSLALLDPFPELRDARGVVRPGISGLWQVRARDINVTGPDMADDDFEYIENYSFLLDISILLRTFTVLNAGG